MRTLKLIRRIALVLCVLAFALSFVGMFAAGKGWYAQREREIANVCSADGVLWFVKIHPQSLKPVEAAWQVHFIAPLPNWLFFYWNTLGFQVECHDNAANAQNPAASVFLIVVPYWAILLALLMPEARIWLRRMHERTIRVIPEVRIESSTVMNDLLCLHCGYNLRTRSTTDRCPECGSPVADTVVLNAELSKSRPGWLWSLAFGNLLLLSVRLLLLTTCAAVYSHAFYQAAYLTTATSVLYVAGTILLTRREHPSADSSDWKLGTQQRILAATVCVCVLSAFIFQQGGRGSPWSVDFLGMTLSGEGYWHWPTLVLLLVAWLLFCVSLLLEFRFLAQLSARVLDGFMSRHCRLAGMGAAVTNLLMPFFATSIVHFAEYSGVTLETLPLVALFCGVVVWLLFLCWTAFMNAYCLARFTQQAWIAAERWRL